MPKISESCQYNVMMRRNFNLPMASTKDKTYPSWDTQKLTQTNLPNFTSSFDLASEIDFQSFAACSFSADGASGHRAACIWHNALLPDKYKKCVRDYSYNTVKQIQ